jgi:hypothetical protein
MQLVGQDLRQNPNFAAIINVEGHLGSHSNVSGTTRPLKASPCNSVRLGKVTVCPQRASCTGASLPGPPLLSDEFLREAVQGRQVSRMKEIED